VFRALNLPLLAYLDSSTRPFAVCRARRSQHARPDCARQVWSITEEHRHREPELSADRAVATMTSPRARTERRSYGAVPFASTAPARDWEQTFASRDAQRDTGQRHLITDPRNAVLTRWTAVVLGERLRCSERYDARQRLRDGRPPARDFFRLRAPQHESYRFGCRGRAARLGVARAPPVHGVTMGPAAHSPRLIRIA